MSATAQAVKQVAELKRAFDRTFGEAHGAKTTAEHDLLAITLAGDVYGLRLSQIGAVHSDRPITRLPGSPPALLGVAGLRGTLLPVYGLRELLGYPGAPTPRWLAVVAGAQVGLAFEQFDGHLRVPSGAIVAEAGAADPPRRRPLVRDVVHTEGQALPIIHLPAVLDAIAALARRPKE